MKGLQHPNVLLFMGAAMSHQHLCIVTEYLPRSVFNYFPCNSVFNMNRINGIWIRYQSFQGLYWHITFPGLILNCCSGCLLHLLKKIGHRLGWRRRIQMALDIVSLPSVLHILSFFFHIYWLPGCVILLYLASFSVFPFCCSSLIYLLSENNVVLFIGYLNYVGGSHPSVCILW